MRDYKKVSVYHLLDTLVMEVYDVTQRLDVAHRTLIGVPMMQAATRATTAVIHGCLSRNAFTLLPYVEEAHALTEEVGQHLRILQKLGLVDEKAAALISQRHQSCNRLLLQWRETLQLAVDEPESWSVNEDDGKPKRRIRRPAPPKDSEP